MGHSNHHKQVFIPHCWEPLSPNPIYVCGWRQSSTSSPVTDVRNLGFRSGRLSPRRGCKCSKVIFFHSPPVCHGINKICSFFTVQCRSAAKPGVCNGSQRSNTEGWCKPIGECHIRNGFANSTSSRWNTDASELISSWPLKIFKCEVDQTRLMCSSAHHEPG